MSTATMELRVRDIVDEVLEQAGFDRDGRQNGADTYASSVAPVTSAPIEDRDHPADPTNGRPPAGGSFIAMPGDAPEPLTVAAPSAVETGTLPRLVDQALSPLGRNRLAAWVADLPEQVSAIPAQRHRMKLIAFIAAWALAIALVVPVVLQGMFSTFELQLDLGTPEATIDAPAPAIEDVLGS